MVLGVNVAAVKQMHAGLILNIDRKGDSIALRFPGLGGYSQIGPQRGARLDPHRIDQGGAARWGPDGYIYYSIGRTELWLCKPDGTAKESIYAATNNEGAPTSQMVADSADLKISHDRSVLAFHY